jgi:hypothetical protein
MSLRERGIYCLPNGRELVVLEKNGNGEGLRLAGWGHFELTEYLVSESGRLLAHGKLTAWGVSDLSDTGRTARNGGN